MGLDADAAIRPIKSLVGRCVRYRVLVADLMGELADDRVDIVHGSWIVGCAARPTRQLVELVTPLLSVGRLVVAKKTDRVHSGIASFRSLSNLLERRRACVVAAV